MVEVYIIRRMRGNNSVGVYHVNPSCVALRKGREVKTITPYMAGLRGLRACQICTGAYCRLCRGVHEESMCPRVQQDPEGVDARVALWVITCNSKALGGGHGKASVYHLQTSCHRIRSVQRVKAITPEIARLRGLEACRVCDPRGAVHA